MRPSDAPEITRSRKAAERQRKREAGLVQVAVWVPKKRPSSRSPRILHSPKGTGRVCLNPRVVRAERAYVWQPTWKKTPQTDWTRVWSAAYKDVRVNEKGKLTWKVERADGGQINLEVENG